MSPNIELVSMPNGFCGLHALLYLTKGSNLVPCIRGPGGAVRPADNDEQGEFFTEMRSSAEDEFGWIDLRSMYVSR